MDSLPIFGKRRKYYIFLSMLASACACWHYGGIADFDASDLKTLLIIQSTASAWGDVAVDALISERAAGKPVSVSTSLQVTVWTSSAVMSLLTSFGWTTIMDLTGGFQQAYMYMAAPLYLVAGAMILTVTEASSRGMSLRGSINIIRSTISTVMNRDIFAMIMFAFLYRATPSINLTLYLRFEHGFSDEFITNLGGFSSLMTIASNFAAMGYIYVKQEIPYRKIIAISTLAEAVIGLTPVLLTTGYYSTLGIAPEYVTLGGELFNTAVDNFQSMIFFSVLARLCSADAAGTYVVYCSCNECHGCVRVCVCVCVFPHNTGYVCALVRTHVC